VPEDTTCILEEAGFRSRSLSGPHQAADGDNGDRSLGNQANDCDT
jgi:hypothetical protein